MEVPLDKGFVDFSIWKFRYMNENRGISVSSIASECRQIKTRDKKLGLVVVDYLQMMAADSSGNRSYELGDVARGYRLNK